MLNPIPRKHIEVRGVVQGVGFRPFVYRIARLAGVRGYVLNSSRGVEIEAEGTNSSIERFLRALQQDLPPLAHIGRMTISEMPPRGDPAFVIRESVATIGQFALVPPDIATCEDCLREITTPSDRRYGYPFTNCTNCGPRYSIIRDVPYDRGALRCIRSACAPSAMLNMMIRRAGGFTPSRTRARIAAPRCSYFPQSNSHRVSRLCFRLHNKALGS